MTSPRPGRAETITQLLERLLDRGYTQAVQQTVEAIVSVSETGRMRVRLEQIQQRAAELAATGERWRADDPILRALLSDVDDALRTQAALINNGAGRVIEQGMQSAQQATRSLALQGLDDRLLAQIGARWNVPDPEVVRELVDVTLRPAWTAELEGFRRGAADTIRGIMVRGVVSGENPLATARRIRDAVRNIPLYRANTLMRTAQLHAYRTATAANQEANADLAERIIRVGTLDDRICLCCLALHGTELRPGEIVRDHHNGRCGSIMVVRGRQVSVRTGEQWLRDQPVGRQQTLMGEAAYSAWQDGRLQMRDFVQTYSDPVFGDMVRQAPLKSLMS